VRLDLFESLPSRWFGCRASTTNSTAKSRSTSLYNAPASSRGGCRALQLYSAPERSTSLQLYSALHSTSSTPSLRRGDAKVQRACQQRSEKASFWARGSSIKRTVVSVFPLSEMGQTKCSSNASSTTRRAGYDCWVGFKLVLTRKGIDVLFRPRTGEEEEERRQ